MNDVPPEQLIEALKSQPDMLVNILDMVPFYIILLSPDYNVLYANRFFRERFGESCDKKCFESLYQRGSPCENCEPFKVLEQMQPSQGDRVGRDGRDYYFYDYPIRNAEGDVFVLEVGIDVTDHKQFKATSLAIRERLEGLLQENSWNLDIRTKQSEKLKQELDAYTFAASHDLQEPLRMVTTFSQLLAQHYEEKPDSTVNNYIQIITDGARRIKAMLDNIMQYSNIENDAIHCNPVNLNTVIREAIANLRSQITRSFAKVTADPLPEVHGDASLLLQVLEHLIGNGIKFQQQGKSPIIHVSTIPSNSDKDVHIVIADNGIGIDMHHLDSIFIPFHRLHAWSKYAGTGFGLPICKKIIELHGGHIWVESELEKGSRFHLVLAAAYE